MTMALLAGLIAFSRVSFDSDRTEQMQWTDDMRQYAADHSLPETIDDTILNYLFQEQLVLLAIGETGVFTPPSVNPYLFERDWSVRPIVASDPGIAIQSYLTINAQDELVWIVGFQMPLSKANEPAGHHFALLGYSSEFTINGADCRSYYRIGDDTVAFASQMGYRDETKQLTLPHEETISRFRHVEVVGFAAFLIQNPGDWSWFETSVNVYVGTSSELQNGIQLGFNVFRMDTVKEYAVSAVWIRYRKEN
jgi:hypothetical protein